MQVIVQSSVVQNLLSKVSYIASAIATFVGAINLQDFAVIMGIAFAALTYIGNRIAVRARRREEREKHQWDLEFHLERQRRLETGEPLHWVEPLSKEPGQPEPEAVIKHDS